MRALLRYACCDGNSRNASARAITALFVFIPALLGSNVTRIRGRRRVIGDTVSVAPEPAHDRFLLLSLPIYSPTFG
jgi:hypothetical protein